MRLQHERIDMAQFNAQTRSQMTGDALQHFEVIAKPLGSASECKFIRSYPIGGVTGYDFAFRFKKSDTILIESIAFDSEGKIAGINLQTWVPSDGGNPPI